ncbi:BLUF domain-containing protein [Altibacter sp.]|uniref:BLUF domain-containing protein n=1 Tax=Altibacter sp. TaxID=2024823 RepID=UPI000C92E1C4|nr:BLUF domain-containing protein [Altibacter sp.]MAP54724.1 blue light sensor protein [Altibacter sp.]
MHTICYLSNKVPHLDLKDIEELFETTQRKNHSLNITGILLYLDGNFLQVLEGKKEVIGPLFDLIKEDSRHASIFVILDKSIEERTFSDYKSGFSVVKNKSDLNNLKDYLNATVEIKTLSKSMLGILEPFLL